FRSTTKSSAFPPVLFITAVSSSLGGAVEGGGSPASSSSSPRHLRLYRALWQAQQVTQVFRHLLWSCCNCRLVNFPLCRKISFRDLGRAQSCCVSKSISLLPPPHPLRDCVRYANRGAGRGRR